MQISKRDWIFIAAIIALLGFLLTRSGNEKAGHIPNNDTHLQFYQTIHSSGNREDVEKRCTSCHSASTMPLSPHHPPKQQCLLCHTLSKAKP